MSPSRASARTCRSARSWTGSATSSPTSRSRRSGSSRARASSTRAHAVGLPQVLRADVERLRWILTSRGTTSCRSKVIKERLDSQARSFRQRRRPKPRGRRAPSRRAGGRPAPQPLVDEDAGIGATRPRRTANERAMTSTPPDQAAGPAARTARDADECSRAPAPGGATRRPDERPKRPTTLLPRGKDGLTRRSSRPPLEDWQLNELESFGLLEPSHKQRRSAVRRRRPGARAPAAAGSARGRGPAPSMYKHFAEREAGLFEQVLQPYLRQRNPEAGPRRNRSSASFAARACCGRRSSSRLRDSLGE